MQIDPPDIRLAPMAGVTDMHFRNLVRTLGFTGVLYTEMVSSLGLYYGGQKTQDMLRITEAELPCNLQLFGHDPRTMAIAAVKAIDWIKNNCGTQVATNIGININMGCPAKKILRNHDGGYMLRELDNSIAVYQAVAEAVPNTVSIKTRLGYDHEIIEEIANRFPCELCVHGRLVTDEYRGSARLDSIPIRDNIILNGDIKTRDDALKYKKVMIGRAVFGQPELMPQLEGKEVQHTLQEILIMQLDLLDKFYENSRIKLNLAKKHLLWSVKERRMDIITAKDMTDIREIVTSFSKPSISGR